MADAVLYDYLVDPRVLRHAPRRAELVCLGRHGRGRLMSQDEVNVRLIELARAGRRVVRLKGGDPAVFARLSEETEALRAAGIPYEVVPGLTAALAVAAYTGIPLTHRDVASAVAFVTGHEGDDKQTDSLDYGALAKFPGTLVFYMGVTTAAQWTAALINAGMPADTPTAIVRRCTWPDQWSLRTTLGDAAREIAERQLRPPVLVIVGELVDHARPDEWATERPLLGQRIVITRPHHQADDLVDQLTVLGAECVLQPAIEIGPPTNWKPVDDAIDRLAECDWLVFSSANGVRYFLDRLLATGGDLRRLGATRLAAIGPATTDELARYHLRSDLQPTDEFRAERLAEVLIPLVSNRRVLLVRASRGREVLAETLRAAGAIVDQVVTYSSIDVETPEPEIVDLLAAGQIDWITVTSSAIARSLVALFGQRLSGAKLASISPITSETLISAGFPPSAEAKTYTTAGLVEAMVQHHRGMN